MNDAIFLGLGSNLGDRLACLQAAVAQLVAEGCVLERASAVYETPPWGMEAQPAFLNAVIEIRTTLDASDLLQLMMAVETRLGRKRVAHWGPRTIDIDLLAYGDLGLVSQRLHVPHPLLQDRAFVLLPWAEIAPNFVVAGLGQSVGQLLEALSEDARSAIAPVGALI
jgi:2-amino-4-hydroxy-6-hydroxymethyldihydropteridine diphosphokinase